MVLPRFYISVKNYLKKLIIYYYLFIVLYIPH